MRDIIQRYYNAFGCRRETGERKKESARGIMGRGEIRGSCRLSLFPSSTTRSLFLLEYPSGASAQKRGTAACAIGKRNVTPQKSKFVKYGIGWYSQEEQDEKCPLARNQPVTANRWGDISTFML